MSLRVFEQIIIIVFVNDTGEDQNNFFQHFLDANSDAKYKHANFYSPPSATLALVGPQNSIKLPFPGFWYSLVFDQNKVKHLYEAAGH